MLSKSVASQINKWIIIYIHMYVLDMLVCSKFASLVSDLLAETVT